MQSRSIACMAFKAIARKPIRQPPNQCVTRLLCQHAGSSDGGRTRVSSHQRFLWPTPKSKGKISIDENNIWRMLQFLKSAKHCPFCRPSNPHSIDFMSRCLTKPPVQSAAPSFRAALPTIFCYPLDPLAKVVALRPDPKPRLRQTPDRTDNHGPLRRHPQPENHSGFPPAASSINWTMEPMNADGGGGAPQHPQPVAWTQRAHQRALDPERRWQERHFPRA